MDSSEPYQDYSHDYSYEDPRLPRTAIVVFARLPVPGRVKTRLAAGAGVGPTSACEFYRACAQHAIAQAASCSDWADVFVYHSSADSTADVTSWLAGEGLDVPCRPQLGARSGAQPSLVTSGDNGDVANGAHDTTSCSSSVNSAAEPDLGAKMLAAMSEAQRRGGGSTRSADGTHQHQHQGKVLIIGSDVPDISGEVLRRAADALDDHEVVLGPSLDGGYYLMGLTRVEPCLFQDMWWSTENVLAETLKRAAAAGLRVAPWTWLPLLRDIDTVQDLAEWITCTVSQNQYQTAAVAMSSSNSTDEESPPTTGQLDPNSPDPIRLGEGKSRQRHAYEELNKLQERMHLVSQKIMEERTAKVAGFSPAAPGSVYEVDC